MPCDRRCSSGLDKVTPVGPEVTFGYLLEIRRVARPLQLGLVERRPNLVGYLGDKGMERFEQHTAPSGDG